MTGAGALDRSSLPRRVLIAIESCHHHKNLNEWQRGTWVPFVERADVRFFIGSPVLPKQEWLPDEVYVDVPDDYKGLPHKTQAIMRWAVDNGYDHIFKSDTDTYVVPSRLLSSGFEAHDYIGRLRDPSGIYPHGYASGGPGYWLSRRAAELVANDPPPEDEAEDRWVGNVLGRNGIVCVSDDRYRVILPKDAATACPHKGNQVITCCEFPGKNMTMPHDVWLESTAKFRTIMDKLRIR